MVHIILPVTIYAQFVYLLLEFIQAFYLQERCYVSLETARANAVSLDWKSFAAGKQS